MTPSYSARLWIYVASLLLGKVVEQYRPRLTGQVLLAKADVAFPPISDYFLPTRLLGASVRQIGTFHIFSFAASSGTFLATG